MGVASSAWPCRLPPHFPRSNVSAPLGLESAPLGLELGDLQIQVLVDGGWREPVKAGAAVDSDNVADLPSSGEDDSSYLDDLSLARCRPLVSVSTRTASLGRRFVVMV